MDLMEALKSELKDEMLSKVAGFLGESETATKKAATGALPMILAGLADVAGKDDGPQRLFGATEQADKTGLGDVLGALVGGKADAVAKEGSSLFGGLFGDGLFGQLAGAVGKYAGFQKPASSKSLLSLLVPLVLGLLGSHSKKGKLDAGGLANLLIQNKELFAKLIPVALGALLPKTGMFGSRSTSRSSAPAKSGGGLGKFLPLIVLVVAGYFLWQYVTKNKQAEKTQDEQTHEATVHPVDAFRAWNNGFNAALGTVHDGASASQAKAALERLDGDLDDAIASAKHLAPADQARFTATVKGALNQLVELGTIAKAMKVPGAAAALQTTVMGQLAKLKAFVGE